MALVRASGMGAGMLPANLVGAPRAPTPFSLGPLPPALPTRLASRTVIGPAPTITNPSSLLSKTRALFTGPTPSTVAPTSALLRPLPAAPAVAPPSFLAPILGPLGIPTAPPPAPSSPPRLRLVGPLATPAPAGGINPNLLKPIAPAAAPTGIKPTSGALAKVAALFTGPTPATTPATAPATAIAIQGDPGQLIDQFAAGVSPTTGQPYTSTGGGGGGGGGGLTASGSSDDAAATTAPAASAPLWPWVVGGAIVAYFVFRPKGRGAAAGPLAAL